MNFRYATIADRDAIARLHTDSWNAGFSQFAPDLVEARGDQFSNRQQQWDEILRDDSTFTVVAVEDDKIIGFAQGGAVLKERGLPQYDGELIRLYVAADSFGQQLGKRLIYKVAQKLQEQGMQSLVVVAWSINTPARAVYEHLGAEFVKEIIQERGGFDNSQTIYVWNDIQTVLDATRLIVRNATVNDAYDIASVHVSSWQTSYKGIMPDEAIAARPLDHRQTMWERILNDTDQQSIILVAELDGQVVGFVSGGVAQQVVAGFDSELYAIYLLENTQGKDIGRKLMQKFVKRLHDCGYDNMTLTVLENNATSRGFYEKMGGDIVGSGEYSVTDDVTLKTIIYGWKDIRTILVEG